MDVRRVHGRINQTAIEALNSLNKEEKFLLYYCLDRGERTVYLELAHAPTKSLCEKGIMEYKRGIKQEYAVPYTIRQPIWEHLQKIQDTFYPQSFRDDQDLQNGFRNFARQMRSNVHHSHW